MDGRRGDSPDGALIRLIIGRMRFEYLCEFRVKKPHGSSSSRPNASSLKSIKITKYFSKANFLVEQVAGISVKLKKNQIRSDFSFSPENFLNMLCLNT